MTINTYKSNDNSSTFFKKKYFFIKRYEIIFIKLTIHKGDIPVLKANILHHNTGDGPYVCTRNSQLLHLYIFRRNVNVVFCAIVNIHLYYLYLY